MPTQPVLPPEGEYTDLERLFISEQPKLLWPTNQNSNLGVLRKALTDLPQEAVDQISELFLELFVVTASGYLSRWEEQVGLPKNPPSLTTLQRRNLILSRLIKTPFTRTRRREIVESYLRPTLGAAPQFTPEGLALTPDGIPLFSDVLTDVTDLYFIVEDIEGFAYYVYISDAATVNEVALNRDLFFFTPAGIYFQIAFYTPGVGRKYGDGTYGSEFYGGDVGDPSTGGADVTTFGDADGSFGGDGDDTFGGD